MSADYSNLEPIFDTSPKKSDETSSTRSRGALSDGPELANSTRTRSFSFSSRSGTCPSPDQQRDSEEFSSFRKDDHDVDMDDIFTKDEGQQLENMNIPGSAPPRARRGSWDGFVSFFHSPSVNKEEAPFVIEEAKHRNVDVFRPYLTFLQAPYDEAGYRAMMKPPLGGLASIISGDLKRKNSL